MPMWLLGMVFAVTGVPFLWIARRVFARDADMARWPRVPGRVIASAVSASQAQYRHEDGHDYAYTAYRPVVRYAYTVDGAALEGESIARSIDGFTMDESAARRLADKYPLNREVMVLHDPQDAKKAHLEIMRSTGAVILLAFGCIWLALGTLLLVLAVV